MLFEVIKQDGGKIAVADHKLFRLFGTVYPCKMENEISLFTVCIEQIGRCVEIVFEYLADLERSPCSVLAVADIAKRGDEIFSHKSGRSGHKDIHHHFFTDASSF